MSQSMMRIADGGANGVGNRVARAFLGSTNAERIETNPEVKEAADKLQAVVGSLKSQLVGRDKKIELLLATILAGGHILLESAPGMAKTLTAKLLAQALNLESKRIQFTPDTMPSDIRGAEILNTDPDSKERFVFQKGPVFTQLVIADEINRGSPKAQSAFFDAMAEGKLTATNGEVMDLPFPFIVMATQNPIEQEGTNPLPEAQLDRFAVKVGFDELSESDSRELLKKKAMAAGAPSDRKTAIEPILKNDIDGNGTHELIEMQRLMNKNVVFTDSVLDYINRVARGVKPHVEGAQDYIKTSFQAHSASGERSAETLMNMSRALAFVQGRSVVEITDVQAVAEAVLPHRVRKTRAKDALAVNDAIKRVTEELAFTR